MKKFLEKIVFNQNTSIRNLMKNLSNTIDITDEKGFAIVVNKKNECVGTITDGDLRRYLSKFSINNSIKKVMNKNFYYVPDYYSKHRVLKEFDILSNKTNYKINTLPILDRNKKAVNIINHSEFLSKKKVLLKIEKFKKKKVIVKIPGRLSFGGGGLDFTKVILKNKINILSVSVNRYCEVEVSNRNDYKILVYKKKKKIMETDLHNVHKFKNLIASTIDFCRVNNGLNIHINSSIPRGSGLGGSSALTVALIYALKKIQLNKNLNIYNIIDNAFFAERIKFKIFGGWQDFYGTAFGGFKWITLTKIKNKVEVLKIHSNLFKEMQKYLIFFKFGIKRSSSKINKYISNNDFNLIDINRMNKITQNLKIFLKKKKIVPFFKEVGKSWKLKKSLSPKSLNKMIKNAEKEAKKNGAISYKVLGAGQSGYFLVSAFPKDHKNIIKALKRYNFKLEKINFEKKGLVYKN
jgi:D-glycero-alpha-D-manno-heptose-7-phosphate kinase